MAEKKAKDKQEIKYKEVRYKLPVAEFEVYVKEADEEGFRSATALIKANASKYARQKLKK
ncbi:hypothetical protein [Halobacillus litoralis]|uniref:hypothetical protein n=1 Tax=Halobacillus litoralis TaxID=45668 RepID=UPI002490EC75|nr:hypothetical protein [Halobacillus litoralis]